MTIYEKDKNESSCQNLIIDLKFNQSKINEF